MDTERKIFIGSEDYTVIKCWYTNAAGLHPALLLWETSEAVGSIYVKKANQALQVFVVF